MLVSKIIILINAIKLKLLNTEIEKLLKFAHFYLDYLTYIQSLNIGLKIAGNRPVDSLHFPLRGPAGLFKSQSHHALCWGILDFCNTYLDSCPIEVLTYHRKGTGENATVVLDNSQMLLKQIYEKYPKLEQIPISNE